jgi:hypothetical protein
MAESLLSKVDRKTTTVTRAKFYLIDPAWLDLDQAA